MFLQNYKKFIIYTKKIAIFAPNIKKQSN